MRFPRCESSCRHFNHGLRGQSERPTTRPVSGASVEAAGAAGGGKVDIRTAKGSFCPFVSKRRGAAKSDNPIMISLPFAFCANRDLGGGGVGVSAFPLLLTALRPIRSSPTSLSLNLSPFKVRQSHEHHPRSLQPARRSIYCPFLLFPVLWHEMRPRRLLLFPSPIAQSSVPARCPIPCHPSAPTEIH